LGTNYMKMMGQLKKVQQQMEKAQEELANELFSATSGGGAVKVTVTGEQQVTGIEISKDILNPDDADILSDMLVVALNEAMAKAKEEASRKLSVLGAGLGIPPGVL